MLIRHPLLDAYILNEVLGGSACDLPSGVRTALAGRQVKIVDVGAHVGMATLALLDQLPDAEVIAIEAHPDSARLLKTNISINGLEDQVTAVGVAAGVSEGVMVMEGHSGLAHAARNDRELTDDIPFLHRAAPGAKAVSVPVIDVLPLIGDADLLKIDIEGSEWPILTDSRFKTLSARAVVLEYHPQGAPGRNRQKPPLGSCVVRASRLVSHSMCAATPALFGRGGARCPCGRGRRAVNIWA